MTTPAIFLLCAEAYLLGSVPFGYLLYRWRKGGDVRQIGSGNIGATNVLRGAGKAVAAATLVLDVGKGYLAVLIAANLTGHSMEWMSWAATIAIAGHIFSIFLGFRGGKGVATGMGAFLAFAPVPALCALAFFLLIGIITRYISLASMLAAAAFPLIFVVYQRPSPSIAAAAFAGATLIIARHRSNMSRLLRGTERRIHFESQMHAGRPAEH